MARTAKNEKALTPEEKLAQTLVPDVEQPYRVPENWCWIVQGQVSSFCNGRAYKQAELLEDETKTPVLRVGNLFTNTSWYYSDLKLDENKYIDNEDLIYAWSASFGPFIWRGGRAIYHYHIWKVELTSALKKEFYYYWLLNDTERLKKQGHGTGMIHVTKEMMENTAMPLPPLAEQQRIVDRIESLFAKLDEAKEKAQAVVDGFEDRKAAILHKAFTGELTAEWRQNNGVSRDTWNNYTIGDMFIHTTGKALKKSNTNGSLHKYITTSNLYWGRFDFSEVREMYFTDDELDKCTAKKGDLLICNGGDVGRAAIWNYDYNICIQNHISKLRKKQNNIDVVFCYYFFMLSKIKGKINSKGIGIASLSAKDLLAMRIDVPSIEEQHEISSILDELFNNEQQAKEAAEQVIDQIDTMKKSILARAFRGELGTNDPAEGSAVELLKRVLEDNKNDEHAKPNKKRTIIPKTLEQQLSNGLERDLVLFMLKANTDSVSMKDLMSISSKKFELMDTIRKLEKKGILKKDDSGQYCLGAQEK